MIHFNPLLQADNHNDAGNISTARSLGSAALCCNVCVLTVYTLAVIAGIVILALFLAGVAFADEHCHTTYNQETHQWDTVCD